MTDSTALLIPTNEELKKAILLVLPSMDLENVSRKMLTSQLSAKYNWDLSNHKEVIVETINEFVDSKVSAELVDGGQIESKVDEGNGKRKGGGFAKPVQLATELAAFMKSDFAPRTEVTKAIWKYIKDNNLQNPADKREVICDEVLFTLIKKPKIHFMKMTKVLSKLMKSAGDLQEGDGDDDEDGKPAAKKQKTSSSNSNKKDTSKSSKGKKATKVKSSAAAVKTEKSLKAKSGESSSSSGGQSKSIAKKALRLSDGLAAVLKHESLPRTQVVSEMWKYIKEKNLQNPANKREILLDSALENVFKTKKFTMFSMNKLLTKHLFSEE